ncbi:hypothetical protein BDY21DRAFT_273638, partial [Lineolata rhizophorae]
KPPAKLTIPKAGKVKAGPYPQDEVLQTPVTLVLAEALISLLNPVKQNAYSLNNKSIQRRQRLDYIRLLTIINNEAKVRRSTKLVVLGKAKVISCEDLKEARARRAAKE